MSHPRDSWTLALVIVVSIVAVKIGVHNLEWGLRTVAKIVTQMEVRNE